ncbi:hypothetical protein [Pedobacter aquatilis]|uniref:hypothetical protein n=1 Tax=Pedobacter aquatilis TaxID=351343 RepID=UPI00292DBECF|nr:hypothetical protein [Pedobacter aquatilis]
MIKIKKLLFGLMLAVLSSCVRKTDKDKAIDLVEAKYENAVQKLNFDQSNLDSLYNISPKAYADSIKRGKELDSVLAVLESQIEHLSQKESDSVGQISAALTKQRYQLLDLAKKKPEFIGWKLTGVKIEGNQAETLSVNFDKAITKIMP